MSFHLYWFIFFGILDMGRSPVVWCMMEVADAENDSAFQFQEGVLARA